MGNDEAMLDLVTSATVACGFHAGDPLVMHATMTAAARGVSIGAHPGFLDLWGFARRAIQGENPADIETMVIYQIEAAQALAAGTRIACQDFMALCPIWRWWTPTLRARSHDRLLARDRGDARACTGNGGSRSLPIEPMTTTATWRPAKWREPSFTTRVWQPRGCAA